MFLNELLQTHYPLGIQGYQRGERKVGLNFASLFFPLHFYKTKKSWKVIFGLQEYFLHSVSFLVSVWLIKRKRKHIFFSSLNKKVKPSLTDTITFCHFFRLILLPYKNIILRTSSAETLVHAPSCIGCVEMIKHTIYTHLTWSDVHRTHTTDASWKYIAPYFFRLKLNTYFFRLFEFSILSLI